MGNNHTANRHGAVIDDHTLDFLHKNDRDALHTRSEVGSLRATARFLWEVDFSAAVLSNRLNRCLVAKQLDGIIAFAAQLDRPLLLKAIWLVDTQQWTEVADALKVARQRGYCQLPITLAVADMQRHDSKQAYLADVRVIALWKMVGRHVNCGGHYGRFELFDQPGGGVRAIKDEPGFELDINPPLPAAHPYHTHIIDDNPPVRSTIHRHWAADGAALTQASASSFIMRIILAPPAANEGRTAMVLVNRHDYGGVLGGLLSQSPHQPPNGCTAVVAVRWDDDDPPVELRQLLLTPLDSPFVACTILCPFSPPATTMVGVLAVTNEPPVGDPSAAFKDRRPATAPLVGGPLGSTIADMVVNQQEKVDDEEEGADDDDGDGGEEDDNDSADDGDSDEDVDGDIDGDGNGDGEQQEQEDEEGEGVEREAKRRRLEDS
ncbi:unnamed protein product [Vitrella brassicaformis CCMP3155]|uniref:Uncharacterized protein n=1 Tax=Vitrella brassicaformis (strain CCMP3155) TaxID=1169540 RepID=A0A0G4F7A4_VITBC|nr:unnamed protein product [Vitrella brassicaformis CCMP3155]|eukprot:CEM07985.1 unnamed protein product [Vitrella brassicaformis CCMP3155]